MNRLQAASTGANSGSRPAVDPGEAATYILIAFI